MIKNRTVQLVYLSMSCAIGVIAALASVGLFDGAFRWDFYMQFTNLSNYICLGILISQLIDVIKKTEDSLITARPLLGFIGLVAILLTFFVYNFILAPTKSLATNFSAYSITLHVMMPIFYTVSWILFCERGATWKFPLLSSVFPIGYITFVFLHAACFQFDSSIINFAKSGPHIYPYFFLNVDKIGADGVIKWIIIIAVAFISLGYVMYGVDRIISRCIKRK